MRPIPYTPATTLRRLLPVLLLLITLSALSQDAPIPPTPISYSTFAVYGELEGAGMALSANADYRFSRHRPDGFGMRFGFGYNLGTQPTITTIPIGLNYLAGRHGNFFELGAGATYMDMEGLDATHKYTLGNQTFDKPSNMVFANTVIGYRHQPSHGGFNFRAGLSPYFGNGAGGILFYLSMGSNF